MSEYIVQRNSLVNVADEIRVLSGTTEELGLDEMATNVADANTTIDAQATTISEIAALLEGKSVPGGGEDVTEELATQTALISDLEVAVNALPNNGSGGNNGGSSGNITTCNVILQDGNGASYLYRCVAPRYVNGSFTYFANFNMGAITGYSYTIENVVCGAPIYVQTYGDVISGATVAESNGEHKCLVVDSSDGETVTILLEGND